MMKLLRGSLLAAAMVVGFAGFASAEEISATVDNVDTSAKTVTIAGMTLKLPSTVDPGSINVGDNYDVTYSKDNMVQQITPSSHKK